MQPNNIQAFPHDGGLGNDGMDLRDYFAAKAMQGCLAYSLVNPATGNFQENCSPEGLAKHCYALADAMLAERAKQP